MLLVYLCMFEESVRVAAERCVTTLSAVTVRLLTGSTQSDAVRRHIGDVLHCLLVTGMQSKVDHSKVGQIYFRIVVQIFLN